MPKPVRLTEAGVTLIEMMIVLAIIGVATGAAALGLGALARDDRAEIEARRLATVINAAVDQVLIAAGSQQLDWDRNGYLLGDLPRHALDADVVLSRADGLADAALVSAEADGGPVVFVLKGSQQTWAVTFDGLLARASLGDAP